MIGLGLPSQIKKELGREIAHNHAGQQPTELPDVQVPPLPSSFREQVRDPQHPTPGFAVPHVTLVL